ncbi:MAG: 16S rRNA (cytosine(1402)-N(4))-methyltransferase RsmH [Clostridia bacterium]
MDFKHTSVLLNEVIDGLKVKNDGIYVDCTLGGGGHSKAILQKLAGTGHLIGFDQDNDALNAARINLSEFNNVTYINSNFVNLSDKLLEARIMQIDGLLIDLGVSSYQLDNPERGFSYKHNAPLNMAMDKSAKVTAYNIINEYPEEKLTKLILDYGEERWAKRISEFIVAERKNKQISTTFELVEIIKKAIPAGARQQGGHPARQTFQAIRIETNQELDVLSSVLKQAVNFLKPNGRLAVISFHSLEDRIVKDYFKYETLNCSCPASQPICTCDKIKKLRLISKKPIVASDEEITYNNRSRSAKLRIAEKI